MQGPCVSLAACLLHCPVDRSYREDGTVPGDRALSEGRPLNKSQAQRDAGRCSRIVPHLLADNPGAIYTEAAERACKPGHYKIQCFVQQPTAAHGGHDKYTYFHFYRQNRDVEYRTQQSDTPLSIAVAFGTPVATVLEAVEAATNITAGGRLLRKVEALLLPASAVLSRQLTPLAPGTQLLLRDVNLWSHKVGWSTGALLYDACGRAMHDPLQACRQHFTIDYNQYCGSFCVKSGSKSSPDDYTDWDDY